MTYSENVKVGTLVPGNQNTHKYIEQILGHGFETFSITFWQTCEGIDLKQLAADVKSVLKGTGKTISTLGIFGNPLETRPKDLETVKGWERCIDAAGDFGCDIVDGFAGRLVDKKIDESLSRYVEIFKPLSERAKAKGVRLRLKTVTWAVRGIVAIGIWRMLLMPGR